MAHILLLGTYHQAPYHPLTGVDRILTDLLSDLGEIRVTDRLEDLAGLQSRDLLISYLDQWDTPIPKSAGDAILDFMEKDGRMLILHNGISLQSDERLIPLMGGRFDHHPAQVPLCFSPEKGTCLEDIPAFTIMEEPYQFTHLAPDLKPLLTYVYDGKTCLAGWKRGEHVIYRCPGHTAQTFEETSYQQMIRRCAAALLA